VPDVCDTSTRVDGRESYTQSRLLAGLDRPHLQDPLVLLADQPVDPQDRVDELVGSGAGRAFAPAGRVFKEWVSIPQPDRQRWLDLMREGIAFVGRPPDRDHRPR
jgi:hypothetical protein